MKNLKSKQQGGIEIIFAILLVLIFVLVALSVKTVHESRGLRGGLKEKIEVCEKDLPRNQYCEIIAVPVESNSADS